MIIDFNNMTETIQENFKGGEKCVAIKKMEDEKNRIMFLSLEPGASIGMHTHTGDSETIYIVEGKGKVLLDEGEEKLTVGVAHYCPEGHRHSVVNDSDAVLKFFAIVPKQ